MKVELMLKEDIEEGEWFYMLMEDEPDYLIKHEERRAEADIINTEYDLKYSCNPSEWLE